MSDVISKLSVECGLLKARTLELEAKLQECKDINGGITTENIRLVEKNAALEAENKRLREAGDALEDELGFVEIWFSHLITPERKADMRELRAIWREACGE